VVISKVGVNLRLNGRAGKLCGEVTATEVEFFSCSGKIRCGKVRRPEQEWKVGREEKVLRVHVVAGCNSSVVVQRQSRER
jgi:hypothetical protein